MRNISNAAAAAAGYGTIISLSCNTLQVRNLLVILGLCFPANDFHYITILC